MRTFLLFGLSLLLTATLWAQQPLLTHGADGRLQQSQHDIYDSHDRLAVRIVYSYDDSTGAVESRTLTGYDHQGRIQRVEVYSADERLLFTDTYHYRHNGKLRKRVQCSYDENGQLVDKQTLKPSNP